jgi:peptidoglycan/LPS O-acetylase OafA/YrhL
MNSIQTAFRLDIQILRGIAVIYVILFHLNLDFFSSGFLGVDVFFVISGFLMTVIYKNSNAIEFYKKRAIRLLPAYFFTIFLAIFLAVLIVNPIDLEEVLEEALYASFFLSNIGFLNTGTYYSSTELRPLLHFWSLSVEMQYYLLFPLLFYFARKHAANSSLIISASLLICFYLVSINSLDASFYLMPTRIWEFFLGYIAATHFNSDSKPNMSKPIVGLFGLIIITCIPLIMIDEESSSVIFGHPGLWACVVCLATGLILAYGLPSYIEKSFTGKALIQVGKYSYSAYLSHFIVIVFYNYQPFSEGNVINIDSYFGVLNNIILIVFLTFITYHCGEKWLKKELSSPERITGFITILLLVGLISKPLQLQLLSKEERLLYNASLTYSSKRCSIWQQIKSLNKEICALNDTKSHYKNILLVGDSHAGAIKHTFSSTAEQYEYNTFFTKKNSALTKDRLTLKELHAEILSNKIDGVVLHYATDNLIKDNDFLLHKIIELGNILKERGIDVSIIMPTPKFVGKQPLKEIFYNIKNNTPLSSMSLDDYQQSNARVEILLNDFQNLIKKYDSAYLFCYKNCIMVDELQQPVYVDAGHLTKIGAQRLIPVFNKVFTEITNNLTKSL